MPNFVESFSPIYKIPSINFASVLATAPSVNSIVSYSSAKTLTQAVQDETKYQMSLEDGLIEENDNHDIAIESIDDDYDIENNNGVLSLNQTVVKVGEPAKINEILGIVNESDRADYDQRYIAADIKYAPEDGTNIAFIRIVDKLNPTKVVFPPSGTPQPGITETKFKQFIVLQSNHSNQERLQIVETNADYQALFFNRKPEILQVAGVLKNTIDNPWSINMLFAWDEWMRGTKLVEGGNVCQMYIDGELYDGYPFNFNRSKSAPNDFIVNFSMSFLIRKRISVHLSLGSNGNKNGYQSF